MAKFYATGSFLVCNTDGEMVTTKPGDELKVDDATGAMMARLGQASEENPEPAKAAKTKKPTS